MRRCVECVKARVAAEAVLFSAIFTLLYVTSSVLHDVRQGYSPTEIAARGLMASAIVFAVQYRCWGWLRHYAHEARPRTRYVLRALAWSGVLLFAAMALYGVTWALLSP